MNENKHSTGSAILGIIVVVWFIASMAGIFYTSSTGLEFISIILFGQYFFVFGIFISISGKSFNPVALIPTIVGALIIAGALIYHYGDQAQVEDMLNYIIPAIVLLVFISVGVGLIIAAYRMSVAKKRRCTEPLEAVCIDIKSHYSRNNGRTYCPVYMVEYKGKVIEICSEMYSSPCNIKPGDIHPIMVNPDNPKDFYEAGGSIWVLALVMVIMGLTFMIMPTLVVFMVLIEM